MSPISLTLHGEEYHSKRQKKASHLSNPTKRDQAATRPQDEETATGNSSQILKRKPPTRSKATPSREAHIIIATTTTGTTITTIETATIAAEAEEEARTTEAATEAISSATGNTNPAAGVTAIMAGAETTITKRETMWHTRRRTKSNRARRGETDSTIAIEITEKTTIGSTTITTGEKATTITEAITEITTKNPIEIARSTMIERKTTSTTHKKTSKTQSPLSQRLKRRSS